MAKAKSTDILSYLEVDLEKFVSKGNSDGEWTEDLEELSDKIKIILNVGTDLDANKTYVVVREHEGVYEQIPAVYDKTAGTLTFESDKFSVTNITDCGGALSYSSLFSDLPFAFQNHFASGKITRTVVPFPISLCSSTAAWCIAAACLTMDRPRPVPPVSFERLLSTR